MNKVYSLSLLLLLSSAGHYPVLAQDFVEVPRLTSRVTDLTNTLTPQQTSRLENTLLAFESQKGSQVAVLLIRSTKPETIEGYAIRVAEAWKIGRKKVDDGVILLIAKDDRRMRIEVGYGLEGVLTDSVADQIIRSIITPHFRQNEFYTGIQKGVAAILSVIQGEKLPEPTKKARAFQRGRPKKGNFMLFFFILAFILAKILRGSLGAGISGFIVTFASVLLGLLFFDWLIGLFIGIFASVFSGSFLGGMFLAGAGGFRGGGFPGGGGFMGGGGGFGGGGASGGW